MLVEDRTTVGWRDRDEILQRSHQAAGDLRRAGAGQPDLVESQVDVGVPVHHRDHEPQPANLVVVAAIRELTTHQLAETVVEAVERLDSCGRVEERRFRQPPFGHVDQHPEAIGHVFVEGSFQAPCEFRPGRTRGRPG